MATQTLNILKPSVNNLTVRIFTRAAGLECEEVDVWGKTTTPEYMAKYPAHLTPMLEEAGLLIVALVVLAIISLSLAIVNLFPFLPLDGGHIFWAIVEKIRRRPVPFSVMERASVIGFGLVMIFFFIGLSNDINRLTGEGFQTR